MVVVLRHSICAFNYSSLTAETVFGAIEYGHDCTSPIDRIYGLSKVCAYCFNFFYLLLLFYFFNTAILKNKRKEKLKYNKIILALTILTGKDWCLTQFSTGMAGSLLLIFFICLRNQLSSMHSIISTNVWKIWFIK